MEVHWNSQSRVDDGDPLASGGSLKRSLRILIVDDSRDCAVSLMFLCRLWGHLAECCYDSAAALALAESFRPDAFLLDLAMPFTSGYDLVRELKTRASQEDALFVAMSGYIDEPHRTQATTCGFHRFFGKPLDLVELKDLLSVRATWPVNQTLAPISELVSA